MKIAIIGAGAVGLTAAYLLAKEDNEVYLFEKENEIGGLAGYFKDKNWSWSLEKYYHHFFSSDKEVFEIAKELGIENKLFFKIPKTSVFVDGQIYPFDNPKSILLFPKLNLIDKVRTGMTSVFLKLNPFWKPLEKITAEKFIKTTMGKNSFNIIWKPLLISKFGEDYKKIPASWFWTRIKKRSFSLGYFEGGYETLLASLQKAILNHNGQILLKINVDSIKRENNKFKLFTNEGSYPVLFDKVIATTPPTSLLKIFPDLSETEKKNLEKFESIGSLCLCLELKNSFLTDGTYWLSINDSNFPFVAVVEHTNFMNMDKYGGKPILYIGGYYPKNHPFFKLNQKEIINKFMPYLKKINKEFTENEIEQSWLFKDLYAQPVVDINYSQMLPKTRTSIPGFFWASLHHVYPEDRGTNYAIALGKKIAYEIKKG